MTPPLTRGFGWRSRHGAAAPIEKLLALLSAEGPGGLWRRLQARRQGRLPRPLHSLDLPWRPRPPRPCLPDLAADIVVPVYEAPEALAACLESLRRHTDLTRHRLLVVDDGSRSPAVFELLNELERWAGVDGARVEIMRQAENRGFVASANLGFARAKGDVVLLNSDTEVTPGWLERLAGAAHSAPDVASVTPFSNDATICSLPRLGEANRLPPGWSPAQFASLVERLSPRLLPELPTGVGFCLYLRREALEQVGTFDEETFGAGYGEENDWCMRAAELGWRHLLEDATFVFHRGSASFSPAEGERRSRLAQRILEDRWPQYRRRVGQFLNSDPLALHRRVLAWGLAQSGFERETRRVALLLPRQPDENLGGMERHARDLADNLPPTGWEPVLLFPHQGWWVAWWRGEDGACRLRLPRAQDQEQEIETLAYLLRALAVECVHIQHLHGLDFGLAACAGERPLLISLHDFEFFCRRYDLLEQPMGRFCEFSRDPVRCQTCLRVDDPEARLGEVEERRRRAAELLVRADLVVAPSSFTAAAHARLFAGLADGDRLRVLPHGLPRLPRQRPAQRPAGTLHAAFLGAFRPAKGSGVFAELVESLSAGAGLRWSVVGGVEDFDALERARQASPVRTTGPYLRSQLPELLARWEVDCMLLLSIWPEAFGYTLSEALATGLPIVAFDVGAFGERLRAAGAGDLLVPPSAGACGVAEKLRGLLAQENAPPSEGFESPTLGQMAGSYAALYELASQRRRTKK